jgi:hypothetical protein
MVESSGNIRALEDERSTNFSNRFATFALFWNSIPSNAGFDSIRIPRDDPKHCHGPAVTIAAMMQSAVAGDHESDLAFG